MTQFIHTKVEVLPGLSLTIDGNSKITAGNGTFLEPKPNALSLPHISTCPGSTEVCRSTCYVHGLQKHAPEVYEAYRHNERVMHRILMTPQASRVASATLGAWIAENCQGGFRWHVSGDVMNDRHAQWIVDVSRASGVRCWIYTRSIDLVPLLFSTWNLIVNISCDSENWEPARAMAGRLGVRLCYLTVDGTFPELPPGSVIFPDYALRGRDLDDPTSLPWWQGLSQDARKMVCPADFYGQSRTARCGVCTKCLV
jgi:hypothetical protein